MFICRHIVLGCPQSSGDFQYVQVQQGEGCDFSPCLLSYSGCSYLFTHLFCWKQCWSYRFLSVWFFFLEVSGAWNARWTLAKNNYKIRGTAWFPLSVRSSFKNATGNGNWNILRNKIERSNCRASPICKRVSEWCCVSSVGLRAVVFTLWNSFGH